MALVRNWRIIKYGGCAGDIRDVCKTLDLKGCKRIVIAFDPFRTDSKEIRDFSFWISSYKASKSNPHAIIRTDIVTDRSEPTVTVDLINGEKLLMKCSNLKAVELFKFLDQYVTPLAPKDNIEEKSNIEKIDKKSKKGKRK